MFNWPKRKKDNVTYEVKSEGFISVDPVADRASTIPANNTAGYIIEESSLAGIPLPLKQTMKLRCTAGEHAGRTFTLSDKDYIGRAPQCRIHLSDDLVARLHCQVRVNHLNKWYICGLGSNGMSINGVRAQRDESWHVLNVHDKLTIIDSEFVRID